MRAIMPFDTEKERRPIKLHDWSFSWRQTAYFGGALMTLIQSCQFVYMDSLDFIVNIIFMVMCIPLAFPFIYFAMFKSPLTGHYMDRHLWYKLRHKKSQSGVWRG
jgi:hypothetical protein